MCREATPADAAALGEIFREHILADPSYVSHGEIQMGIADAAGSVTEEGLRKWDGYIGDMITGTGSRVFVAEAEEGVAGFVVAEIASDRDRPFGVICDLVVRPAARGKGLGHRLLDAGLGWLRQQGVTDIYLESGKDNHAAHAFFERVGFGMVSHVFRLQR